MWIKYLYACVCVCVCVRGEIEGWSREWIFAGNSFLGSFVRLLCVCVYMWVPSGKQKKATNTNAWFGIFVLVGIFLLCRFYQAYGIYGVVNLVAPLLLDASCLIDSNRENTIIQRYDVIAATIFKCAYNRWKREREKEIEEGKKLYWMTWGFFFITFHNIKVEI